MITLPLNKTEYCDNIYWVYAIMIKDECAKSAKEVIRELKSCNIGARPFFYPTHKQPVFNDNGMFLSDNLKNSEKLYEKGLYIPSGLALKKADIVKVSNKFSNIQCIKI